MHPCANCTFQAYQTEPYPAYNNSTKDEIKSQIKMRIFSADFSKNKSQPNPQPFLCHVSRILCTTQRRHSTRELYCVLIQGQRITSRLIKLKALLRRKQKRPVKCVFVCVGLCWVHLLDNEAPSHGRNNWKVLAEWDFIAVMIACSVFNSSSTQCELTNKQI